MYVETLPPSRVVDVHRGVTVRVVLLPSGPAPEVVGGRLATRPRPPVAEAGTSDGRRRVAFLGPGVGKLEFEGRGFSQVGE